MAQTGRRPESEVEAIGPTFGPRFDSTDSMSMDMLDEFSESAVRRAAPPVPITELPNSLTSNLDLANAEGIVRLMRQCDAQTLNGFQDFPAIADREVLETIVATVDRSLSILERKGRSRVIISGAGTSGRLAMMSAAMMNGILRGRRRGPLATYTIAGGDAALVVARENAEDSPARGVVDLERALGDADNVVYIGVTCGLSAPYVMGQVEHLRDRDNTLVILIGFTPTDRARTTPVEGWNKTCAQVAQELAADPRHVVLTPVVGPEALTGSTRLKGATATRILIEMVTVCALAMGGFLKEEEAVRLGFRRQRTIDSLRGMLRHFEDARTITYMQSDHLTAMIERGARALKAGRHIYYLGTGTYGVLGLVDAAECPPTFGADPDEVRGFVEEGWLALTESEAPPACEKPALAPYCRIDFAEFESAILPTLTDDDFVIGIGEGMVSEATRRLLGMARERGAGTGAIIPMHVTGSAWLDVDVFAPILLARPGITDEDRAYAETAVKLALNCISTGAYVLGGKVFGNRMVDLKLSNAKLFERAIGIVSDLVGVNPRAARAALLTSIHETDHLGPAHEAASIADHVAVATTKRRVVPRAMLLATGRYSLAEATAALEQDPIVRNLIGRVVGGGG